MTEVSIAYIAKHLYPPHTEAAVGYIFYNVVLYGQRKGRPTSAAVKFFAAVEQRRAAARTGVEARFVCFTIFAAPGALGAVITGDAKLLRSQEAAPFSFGFFHAAIRGEIAPVGQRDDIVPVHAGCKRPRL